jgi:hypothetical protein
MNPGLTLTIDAYFYEKTFPSIVIVSRPRKLPKWNENIIDVFDMILNSLLPNLKTSPEYRGRPTNQSIQKE